MLGSPLQTAVAGTSAGLVSPAQVAADSAGDVYVADPGLKQVLYFKAGSSGVSGSPIGSGWSSPTGVAVDGSGDVYVADSGAGTVTEFPAVGGTTSSTGQTVASNLGKDLNLNLAVNGIGEAFVADPQNSRVVIIPNPAAVDLVTNGNEAGVNASSTVTVSSILQPFSAPSAVAVDNTGNLFVADGQTLLEISPLSLENLITNQLTPPVTGLAVEPSGSVLVAQKGGILRIPSIGGTLTFNSAGLIASGAAAPVTAPNGVALDQQGNVYVSDMTSGPNLYELATTGSINFGDALTPELPTTQSPALYNTGNMPLMVTGTPTFSVGDAYGGVYDFLQGGTCDTTGATSVTTGLSCTLDLQFTGPAQGVYSNDSMTVATNAANAGSITAWLGGTVLANLEPTQTAISLNPQIATVPGSTTVTVSISPAPPSGTSGTTNTPSGKVDLSLACWTQGCTQATITQSAQATGTDAGTTATFNLANIPGGSYCVTVAYEGSIVNLFQPSASPACVVGTPNFTVNPASPSLALTEPLGIVANAANGIYYVEQGQTTITLTANLTSTASIIAQLGKPSGTVTFTTGASLANNGTQVGTPVTVDANGNAVLNTSGLAVGSYNIYANYSGDQNYAATATAAPGIAFQVVISTVLITASPASVSTPAGTPVTSNITLYSIAGFSASNGANISCVMGTLYYAECTFSVPQPVICAPSKGSSCTGMTPTVVTVSTNIPVNLPPGGVASVQTHRSNTSPLIPAGIFGFGLFGLALRRKKIFNRGLLNGVGAALMLIGVVMGVGGCTNSSYTKTPPPLKFTTTPGTYQLGIVVTDPGTGKVESLPFTLAVTVQ
jgi:sugar lactone lactonase YvrE